MKITCELKSRMDRGLDQKYKPENEANEKQYQSDKDRLIPSIVSHVEEVLNSDSIIRAFWEYRARRNPSDEIRDNFGVYCPTEMERYRREALRIKEAKKMDYETLAIQISYQKDIEGIKETFTSLGLTF